MQKNELEEKSDNDATTARTSIEIVATSTQAMYRLESGRNDADIRNGGYIFHRLPIETCPEWMY